MIGRLEGKPMNLELAGGLNQLIRIHKHLSKLEGYHVSYFKRCLGSTSLRDIKLLQRGET